MLRLITDQPTPENPTIGVRWCLDREDKTKLFDLKAVNVHVLIAVRYENGAEDRQLLPLGDAMTYVMFRFPGTHKILARLVWPNEGRMLKMKKYLLERSSRTGYGNHIVDYEGDSFLTRLGYVAEDHSEIEPFVMNVEVSEEHFAKEWSEGMKWWVNWAYSYPPVDQCQFRRRMLFAFTLQPIVVAALIIINTVIGLLIAAMGVLLFARGLTLRPLLHPFDQGAGDVWPKMNINWPDGSHRRWARSAWMLEDRNGYAKLWRFFVSPIFFALVLAVLTVLSERFDMSYIELITFGILWVVALSRRILEFLLISLGITLVYLVILAIIVAVTYPLLTKYYNKKVEEQKRLEATPEYQEARRREEEAARRRMLEEAYRFLTCPRDPEPTLKVNLEALPPERRTLRLRYLALKRELCRPYAR